MAESSSNTENGKRPDLYALLVGVNRYPSLAERYQLGGCIGDMELLEKYLKSDHLKLQFNDIKIKKFTSSEAGHEKEEDKVTKANVVDAFRSHLGSAKPGDSAVFFFAGHGLQEQTNIQTFIDESTDGNLGGIMMQDFDGKNPGQAILADKELRYLIREVAHEKDGKPKIHLVTIFDCCHSGENTRGMFEEVEEKSAVAKSRQVYKKAIKGRDINDFVFIKDTAVKEKIDQDLPLDDILPQGNHVMLAACRNVELAWESDGNGAFTKGLVEVLQTNKGKMSYQELYSRVLNKMQFFYKEPGKRDKRQTPQFYLRSDNPADRNNTFLTNESMTQSSYGSVEYASSDREWRIDMGALHGVPLDGAGITVEVYPHDDETDRKKTSLKTVKLNYSILDLPKEFLPKEGKSYRGDVEGISLPPVNIYLRALTNQDQTMLGKIKDELETRVGKMKIPVVKLVDDEEGANYTLSIGNDELALSKPFDYHRKVMAARSMPSLPGETASKSAFLLADFKQIANWTFQKDLATPKQSLPYQLQGMARMYPVELYVYEYDQDNETEKRILPKDDEFNLEVDSENPTRFLRFELRNHSDDILHVSMIYMPSTFGFLALENPSRESGLSGGLMMRSQMALEPWKKDGDIVLKSKGRPLANGKGYLRLGLDRYIKADNWQGQENYIKLYVSDAPFNIESFHMEPLPMPGDEHDQNRGFDVDDEPLPKAKWGIRTFKFFVANLDYDPNKEISE